MSVDRITHKLASSLLPGQTVWDETVKGFGIRKQRSAAVYIFKFRHQGRQRFVTIGRHGSPWTTEMAREAAKRHMLGLVDGRNPADERDASVLTFGQFAERYMAEYAAGRKKPRSMAEDRRNLDHHILPSLGDFRLDAIARRDVVAFHAAQSTRPVNANRCLSLISHIFTIAEKWEVRPLGSNPCPGLDRYPERPRERWLDAGEIQRLGAALDRRERLGLLDDSKAADWRAVACIRLLILTGARLGEVLGLQWSWINWDRGFARLPDSKTGPKTIPLPQPALELLAALKRDHHVNSDCKLVLPGTKPGRPFQGIQKPWQRIRKLAGLQDVRIHDLRHCYASFAVASGESLYIVGAILGHRSFSTTQRYAHLALEPIWQAASRNAGRLAELLAPPTPSDSDGNGASTTGSPSTPNDQPPSLQPPHPSEGIPPSRQFHAQLES
jgi:integrase